jgi:hypothetical protein
MPAAGSVVVIVLIALIARRRHQMAVPVEQPAPLAAPLSHVRRVPR